MAELSIASTKDPSIQLRRWFWILLVVNIAFVTGSKFLLGSFTSRDIIQFEIAKEQAVAAKIVEHWSTPGVDKFDAAVNSIYLDYLFILLYVAGISVACVYLSRLTRHEILIRAGRFFGFLVIAAGVCDVLENMAMWYSLHGYLNQWNVSVAYDMAVTKFSILIVCLMFLFISLVFYLVRSMGEDNNGKNAR